VELPLFVLDPMVPGQEITLNVFEERYKRMVRRCMQHTRRFGMVAPADEHHEGATRAATTRERRRGEIPDRNPNPETEAEVIEAETDADANACTRLRRRRRTRSRVPAIGLAASVGAWTPPRARSRSWTTAWSAS
jgi:Lon protease-like protein